MRLFVFAIGGTGSQVLTSLVMQLASGAKMKDNNGNDLKNFSIVPIIIDPDAGCEAKNRVDGLLSNYCTLRRRIHGDKTNAEGFFATKIEKLKEALNKGQETNFSDSFYFRMNSVSDKNFSSFIESASLNAQDSHFAHLVFSQDELNTKMSEGFYGSPNIGSVALYEFTKTTEFRALCKEYSFNENNIDESDRLFFIGSIFGGTGAAGLPLFISYIRHLIHDDYSISKAPIGALVVMPYFNVGEDDKSEIKAREFNKKTDAALRYYDASLNKYLNRAYYIADPNRTSFDNDSGKGGQKSNKPHIVEFAGALALFDFMNQKGDDLKVIEDGDNQQLTANPSSNRARVYSLEKEESDVHFDSLSKQTNNLIMLPMMKFYVLCHYMKHHLRSNLNAPFNKFEPKIEKGICENTDFDNFVDIYYQWLKDMKDHSSDAHKLDLFVNPEKVTDDYTHSFHDRPETGTGVFHRKKEMKLSDINKELNEAAADPKLRDIQSADERWYALANLALGNAIVKYFEYKTYIE